jgi:hypothetical protein
LFSKRYLVPLPARFFPAGVYGALEDTGTFPPWQHLLPGKELTDEDAAMDDTIATIAARNKLDRVASYRQLQGTSHQLVLLSGRTIDDFDLPETSNVRPTHQDESRIVVPDAAGDRDTAYVVDRTSGEQLSVLPPDCIKVPLLTLMLDQGSIGTAGAAFAIFHQGKMVHAKFDKVHRIIRDLKNSEKQCMDSIFMVCKMWSAYLYGMNNRPFNSGANFTKKKRLLELFSRTQDVNSPVFRKYLHRIAKDWKLPCDSEENVQAIYDNVLQMDSFTNKMSQPKQANWFAWNKAAHEQIPEFWPTKMVLESQLDDVDPDCGDSFAVRNPSAALVKMLKAGGGLRLAYRLMTTSMHTNVKIMKAGAGTC